MWEMELNGMNISAPEIAKKKRGIARKTGEVPATVEAQRRHRDRKSIEAMAESTAVAAASAAAKALTPTDMADDLRELIESSAAEVSRILATNGPAVISALVDRAVNQGDTNAAALLTRFIVTPKTKIKLPMQQGDSIEDFADRIIAAATTGNLALQDASQALDLIRTHGEISLSAGLTQRLAALNAQLESARATGAIEATATLQRAPRLSMVDVL
jgi:hypothetical protein